MDIKTAIKAFDRYSKNYDLTDFGIKRKYDHSFRTMNLSENIAKKLDLSETQIYLASLIGLLHDIARFEQWKQFHTTADKISFDHGDMAIKILRENNFIREFIEDDKYDQIIFKAVRNHNKFQIEDGLTDDELLFAKIIRDADKLDIYFQAVTVFYNNKETISQINSGVIKTCVYEQIMNHELVRREIDFSPLDKMLALVAFVFDLNLKPSMEILKEKDYTNKILNKFDFIDENTKKQIYIIIDSVNKFIDEFC